MKSTKQSNLLRSVAFFALTAALILTVCFTASGFNETNDIPEDSAQLDEDNTLSPMPEKPSIPEYFDTLTGLPVDHTGTNATNISFVLNSADPLFGVGASKITIEIPTENGETRFVVHLDKTDLPGKIGSLSPTRDYINSFSSAFSDLIVSYGNDGRLNSEKTDSGFDMSESLGYSYTEYTTYNYTNADLVLAGIRNLALTFNGECILPFSFTNYGEEIQNSLRATRLSISYSETNSTDLVYSSENGEYTLIKNGNTAIDLLSGKGLSYKNVFLLFSDSVTYESSEFTEMILNTDSGTGLFLSNGTYQGFLWFRNESDELVFTTLEGQILEVNRGTSYIAIQKSSESKNIGII